MCVPLLQWPIFVSFPVGTSFISIWRCPVTFLGSSSKGKNFLQLLFFWRPFILNFRKRVLSVDFLLILFSVNTGQIQVGMDPWADRVSFKTLTTDSGKVEWLQLYSYSLRWQRYCHVHVNLTEDMTKLLPGHSEGFYES